MASIPTVFGSWELFALGCAVLFVAQLVYVVFGFGAGLIAVGVLALVMPQVQDVVVLLLLVCLPAELYVVSSGWRSVQWRRVLPLAVGVIVGIPVGAWVLRVQDASVLLVALGCVLVVVGLGLLVVPDRRVHWPNWVGPPVGLAAGVLSGLFGTGGPPVIVYYQLEGLSKTVFRSTLMSIFLLVTAVRVPSYAIAGLITVSRLWSGLALMPAVFLGIAVGQRIEVRLSEATFRRLVSVAITALGAVLLLRQVV